MPSPTVASIKADLLRTPLTAYSRAKHAYDALIQDPHTDKDYLIIYQEVLASLANDGYAPDPVTGAMGPATQTYYANQVGMANPYGYTADTHSLAGVASAPGSGSTPDPDIND